MDNHGLRRLFHGVIIRDFCTAEGITYTKENADAVKQMFKEFLGIESSEALSEQEYRRMIEQIIEISSSELGHHLPLSDHHKSMSELLVDVNNRHKQQNDDRQLRKESHD